MKATKNIPIVQRKGTYCLRKSFEGKQREFPLGKNQKTAQLRANRFMETANKSGLEAAISELRGEEKFSGTITQIEKHYREFCKSMTGGKSPSPVTINLNIARLKLIMKRMGVNTIGEIDQLKLAESWFNNGDRTPAKERTFFSAIRAASSIFSKPALAYYEKKQINIENPFEGFKIEKEKVSPYSPLSPETRKSVFADCQTELPPYQAMIVILAMFAGLRKSEIESCTPANFTNRDATTTIIEIKEQTTDGKLFKPKNKKTASVPFERNIYELLLKLRGDSDCPYFVPYDSKAEKNGRLDEPCRLVVAWLRTKGINRPKPLHDLRREFGSFVYRTQGLKEAAAALRNTVSVCSDYYAGYDEIKTVKMSDSFTDTKSPLQAVADSFGITVEELQARLAKPA